MSFSWFQPFIQCWASWNKSIITWSRFGQFSQWRFPKNAQRVGEPYWFFTSTFFYVKTLFFSQNVAFHVFSPFQSSDIPDVDLMVPSEVSASTSSTTLTTSNVILKPHGNVEDQHQNQQPQLQTIRDEKAGQSKMTLGQMALAGIVISSGPGDHFETFEG